MSSSSALLAAPNLSVLWDSGAIRTCRRWLCLGSPTSIPVPLSAGWEGRVQVAVTHREAIIFLWQDQSSSSCQFCCWSCCLVGRAGKGWGVHGQNENAQGFLLPLRQPLYGWRRLSCVMLPSQHWLLAVTGKAARTLLGTALLSPHPRRSSPPQTAAGNLPALADGTSSHANEPAGFNSCLPLTLIRVSLGHSSASITSLPLLLQDVNSGLPLGWPSSSPPSFSQRLLPHSPPNPSLNGS